MTLVPRKGWAYSSGAAWLRCVEFLLFFSLRLPWRSMFVAASLTFLSRQLPPPTGVFEGKPFATLSCVLGLSIRRFLLDYVAENCLWAKPTLSCDSPCPFREFYFFNAFRL